MVRHIVLRTNDPYRTLHRRAFLNYVSNTTNTCNQEQSEKWQRELLTAQEYTFHVSQVGEIPIKTNNVYKQLMAAAFHDVSWIHDIFRNYLRRFTAAGIDGRPPFVRIKCGSANYPDVCGNEDGGNREAWQYKRSAYANPAEQTITLCDSFFQLPSSQTHIIQGQAAIRDKTLDELVSGGGKTNLSDASLWHDLLTACS